MRKPVCKDLVVEWLGVNQSADVNKEIVQTLSGQFNYNKPQINADERRFVAITHRKGREKRKAQQQNSLRSGINLRRRTRMTRIGRIFTDDLIRAYPCHLCNPCSITFESLSSIPQQGAVQ